MKFELDNTPQHLRAMRDSMSKVRIWMSGYHSGLKTNGGGDFTTISAFDLHMGQIQCLLNDLTVQAEKPTVKAKPSKS